MKKPLDPRKNGLVEPEEFISTKEEVSLQAPSQPWSPYYASIKLETIFSAWQKIVKDNYNSNHQIVDEPILNFGRGSIIYSWGHRNLFYEKQKAEYDAAVLQYEEGLKKFLEHEANKKALLEFQDLDDKIARAEQRLANLKAVKEGKSIPHPDLITPPINGNG